MLKIFIKGGITCDKEIFTACQGFSEMVNKILNWGIVTYEIELFYFEESINSFTIWGGG